MKKVTTYSHFKGKAFVAAQIRRRRQKVYMKTVGGHLTPEILSRWYDEAIAAAKKYALYMVKSYGQTTYVEDREA